MAPKIRILPEQLTNKIAAGEVVERPSSIVKELVENSLDSGCSEVTVEIEGGGKRLIKVSDNGCGMSRDDALLALERHATSKISSDSDLFSLNTLGFRGEAIPSIASVSRFSLATREQGQIEGTEIYAEGGRIKEVKACGMPEGTVVTVRNLFFNTPARFKFLKSNETEMGHVGDILTRLAFSRPEVRFSYICDGKAIFRLLQGDIQNRIASVLGASLAMAMKTVRQSDGNLHLHGLVSSPDCSRSSSSWIYTYINNRYVRDKVVQHAIVQAYRNVQERGRFPVVVLFVQLPASEVDVNVHPTKHEVRFRDQKKVHDFILGAVEQTLRVAQRPIEYSRHIDVKSSTTTGNARVEEVRETLADYRIPSMGQQSVFAVQLPRSARSEPEVVLPQQETSESSPGFFSGLNLIGQFNNSYILCQQGTELMIIDQHAAHERVAFEKMKKQFAAGEVETQGLLFPEPLELSFRESATVGEYRDEIARVGFGLEEFGGTTWIVKNIPRQLAAGDYTSVLRDIIEDLGTLGKSKAGEEKFESVLIRIACHSVVRGQRQLTRDEIYALFAQMDMTDFSGNCPHGRPVFRMITLHEIEKMFRRI